MTFGSINIWWGSSDKEINWDSNSPINTSSWDVEISWNNNSNINASSWDIEVWSDNNGNINSSSGDIKISWDNKWTLKSSSWDIKVWRNSIWSINSSSWDINLSWTNSSRIETSSWKVKVWVNSWEIKTISWKVKVTQNTGDIYTISWNIDIWDFSIKIKRTWTNISVGWTVVITWKNVGNIISCSWNNVSIINWRVFIDWVEQTNEKNWSKNDEYLVEIAWVTINFNEKKYTDTNWTVSDITNDTQAPIKLEWNSIVAIYSGQTIKIDKNQIHVSWNK